MKFSTEIKIEPNIDFFAFNHSLLSIGSCFSENVGKHLKEDGFNICINPFGIIFHPQIIAKTLNNSIVNADLTENFVQRDGRWFHFDYHSRISSGSKKELEAILVEIQHKAKEKLCNSNRLILTFGTAWGYRQKSTHHLVGNCHKLPQQQFEKELADLDELKAEYVELFKTLKNENEKLSIVLTVSPVRHIKNGAHGNTISKSILILLCNYLVQKFDFVHYFPSYEIVLDELRDYRFFKEDLIHPSDQAVRYIYEKFSAAYFGPLTTEIISYQHKLNQLQNHHSIHQTKDDKLKAKEAELLEKIAALKVEL